MSSINHAHVGIQWFNSFKPRNFPADTKFRNKNC